ncbi:RuvC-like Holliday junction resolvase [Vibrio phage D528]
MTTQITKTPRIYAGIDYSMTSPAIAVWDSSTPFRFENIRFYNYYTVKKYEGVFGKQGNISILMQEPHESNEERFRRLSMWAKAVLLQEKVTDASLEDYAMGAKGAVFHIGENTGILKQVLFQLKIPFTTPKPTEVKKVFCGKGNAKKDEMITAFNDLFNVEMHKIIGAPKLDSKPVDDIVDGLAVLANHPDLHDIKIGDVLV